MKHTLIIVLSLITQFAFAALSVNQQKALVDEIAKAERHKMYKNRYTDISTTEPELVDSGFLNEYQNGGGYKEEDLNEEQYDKLHKCIRSKVCSLWNFKSRASGYGGSGEDSHFILINVNSGKYEQIRHALYAE